MTPAARWLRLGLAATWLLDAVLQLQSFMFTKGFGQMLAATAQGNPAGVADPINWSARLIEGHSAWANAAFATVQLFLAAGIAWRPTVKAALAASVVWSLGVWWLGEGLGGVLSGAASPAAGAPGAVIIYAVLAVLLWPADRDAPFEAGRPFGALPARLLWLTLWGSLGLFAVLGANRAPQGLHDMVSGMAAGEPGWLASLDRGAAALLAGQGALASAVLALALCTIAAGIFLAAHWARAVVLLAVVVALAIWVAGENFGAMFAGSATDPNSGLPLMLLAAAYWPQVPVTAAARAGWRIPANMPAAVLPTTLLYLCTTLSLHDLSSHSNILRKPGSEQGRANIVDRRVRLPGPYDPR